MTNYLLTTKDTVAHAEQRDEWVIAIPTSNCRIDFGDGGAKGVELNELIALWFNYPLGEVEQIQHELIDILRLLEGTSQAHVIRPHVYKIQEICKQILEAADKPRRR